MNTSSKGEINTIITKQSSVIQPNNTCYTICPKCSQFPLFQFKFERPIKIKIKCECGYNQILLLEKYLSLLSTHSCSSLHNKTCSIHNKEFKYYCYTCNTHVCCFCSKELTHQAHQLIPLNSNININFWKNQSKLAHLHLDNYCTSLKNNMTKELQRQINKINIAYEQFYTDNKNILSFIELLINSYSPKYPNFYIEKNIINNTNINITEFNNEESNALNKFDNVINYFKTYSIITDIKEGKYINTQHSSVNSLVLLKDKRIASCHWDKNITILKNLSCELCLVGHKDNVVSIAQISNEQLASCSWDRSIKIWSISDGHCEYTINNAHRDRIRKIIALSNRRMASCGDDHKINIWSSDTPYQLIVSISHDHYINSISHYINSILHDHYINSISHNHYINSIIQLKGKEKLVAGESSKIIIWNLSSYQKETIINNIYCYSSDSMLETNKSKLIIGGQKEINIINTNTFVLLKKIRDSRFAFVKSIAQLNERYLVFGCGIGNFCIYDIYTNIYTVKDSSYDITCLLRIDGHSFISGSCQAKLVLWKY